MAERSRRVMDSENTETGGELADDKVAEVIRLVETMEYRELLRLRDLISAEYTRKAEAAKVRVIAEAREKFTELGLTFEDVIALQRKRKRAVRTPVVAKYRSPEGKMWSGKGARPKWIREIEEGGGNRDDYLIRDELEQIDLKEQEASG